MRRDLLTMLLDGGAGRARSLENPGASARGFYTLKIFYNISRNINGEKTYE